VDGDFDMARERAAAIARHDGIRLVEDSADIETCEGAATIGLKLAGTERAGTVPTFDTVLIALGGGALATGVGHVIKTRAPGAEMICIQPPGTPAMTRSRRQRARRHHRPGSHHRRRRRRAVTHPGCPGRPPAGR
jgi:threonine dehydratase